MICHCAMGASRSRPSAWQDEWSGPETLLELLEGLPDPRLDHNKRHKLIDLLAIAILGALCSVDNYVELERFARAKEKFLRTFLELPNGIPSHDTFGRLFAALDPEAFAALLTRWLGAWSRELAGVHVAIDGKAIRAALDRSARSSPMLLVSAFAVESGLVLGQVQSDPESNEIEAVPHLLSQLKLKGALVTLDALHCQRETVAALHEAGAQFVLPVKGNQPELRKTIADHLRARGGSAESSANEILETLDKGHGRLETRRWCASRELNDPALQHLALEKNWPGVNLIGCVERTRETLSTGELGTERTYYMASLATPNIAQLAQAARAHWGIENQLHWVLDMAFDEDHSRARAKNAAQNFALIRKLALNLVRLDKHTKAGVRCKRKMCGWDHDYLLHRLKSAPPARQPDPP